MTLFTASAQGTPDPSGQAIQRENSSLEAVFHSDTGLLSIRDQRNGEWWHQADTCSARPYVRAAFWAAAPDAMPTADWSGATPIALGTEAVLTKAQRRTGPWRDEPEQFSINGLEKKC